MEFLGSLMNHQRSAFLSVMEKVRHIIVLGAPDNNIEALNPSRCSYELMDLSYASRLVSGLKLAGVGTTITL